MVLAGDLVMRMVSVGMDEVNSYGMLEKRASFRDVKKWLCRLTRVSAVT